MTRPLLSQSSLPVRLAAVFLICLLCATGCTAHGADTDQSVSGSDHTTPVSLSDLLSAPKVSATDTASTTEPPTETTAVTTWNDEYPGVPYSTTKYLVVVYLGSQSTVVYEPDEDGLYNIVVKRFTCSTGSDDTPTDTGIYRARAKYRWRFMNGVYGQYCTSISTRYLFHSVPYKKKDVSTLKNEEYDKLGSPASHGCIRMCVRDCKWMYDNIPLGTEVRITQESGPYGPGVPRRITDPVHDGWDPSDRWALNSPYFNQTISG
ncbi:MAG: L,D-transpeptidase [Clostridia bacterium]|nr:L,D-transpeptidase [Clostridia bacterium]